MVLNRTKLFFLSIVFLFFSGCTIKQNDTASTKLGKHVINTPIYLGKAVETSLILGVALIVSPLALVKDDQKDPKEIEVNKK